MQAQEGRRDRLLWLWASLAVAAAVHGVSNILVFPLSPASLLLALLLVGLGLWWTLNRFRWAQRISPFRFRRNHPRIACPGRGRHIFITSRYCQACGRPVQASRLPALICSNCGNSVRPDAGYCTRCGDRLLRR